MTGFTAINLSQIAAPDVVEALDFETILTAMIDELRVRDPIYSSIVESDPAYAILEVCAYREVQIRQRVNDAARSVMLPTATGTDLDNLAGFYGVERLLIDAGDPNAVPPIDPTYESDSAFRDRVQLAPEGLTSAGTIGSYRYWSLTASGKVKDVDVSRPADGVVQVVVLSHDGNGQPDQQTMDAVDQKLNAEDVRPLCDEVRVLSASIISYQIVAELTLFDGPDPGVVLQAAMTAAQDYADQHHYCGYDITLSGIYAALHQPGVQNVNLISPASDLVLSGEEAGFNTLIDVSVVGVDV